MNVEKKEFGTVFAVTVDGSIKNEQTRVLCVENGNADSNGWRRLTKMVRRPPIW